MTQGGATTLSRTSRVAHRSRRGRPAVEAVDRAAGPAPGRTGTASEPADAPPARHRVIRVDPAAPTSSGTAATTARALPATTQLTVAAARQVAPRATMAAPRRQAAAGAGGTTTGRPDAAAATSATSATMA